MSTLKTLKIGDVEYVRKDSIAQTEGDIKIVIVDRGFVYVGRVEMTGDMLIVRSAQNIRKWGTSRGLGELVSGPLVNTILDPVGTARIPLHAMISLIDVEQSAWTCI